MSVLMHMYELKKKYIRKTRTRDPYRDPTGKPGPHWKTRTPSENQDPYRKTSVSVCVCVCVKQLGVYGDLALCGFS